MTEHFNKLTPAKAERLSMLAEELSEAIQITMKIMRHGYESYNPNDPEFTSNDRLLTHEIADVLAVLQMMEKDFDQPSQSTIQNARERKLRYAHHQNEE